MSLKIIDGKQLAFIPFTLKKGVNMYFKMFFFFYLNLPEHLLAPVDASDFSRVVLQLCRDFCSRDQN